MTSKVISRCVFVAVLVIPAVGLARQTFKPTEPAHKMDFKQQTVPQLSITTDAGSPLPIRVHHVSGIGEKTLDASAESIKVTYTKAGMSIELTAGTFTSAKGSWRAMPQPFQTLQIEVGTNAEILWTKVPPPR